MSYIYVITNNINGKQYVGKTNLTINQRFQQHIKDKDKQKDKTRPLYNAFNKYGIEHFSIKQLEECSPEEAAIKEIYWIGKLDTYNNGYNATIGGDSRQYYNYEEIANKYLELGSLIKTAQYFNCNRHTVRRACLNQNIPILSGGVQAKKNNGKSINMIDLQTNQIIKTFKDMSDAGRWLVENNITQAQIKNISASISRVARGTRKSCYGYNWSFV